MSIPPGPNAAAERAGDAHRPGRSLRENLPDQKFDEQHNMKSQPRVPLTKLPATSGLDRQYVTQRTNILPVLRIRIA
jgi:hypothetical protein